MWEGVGVAGRQSLAVGGVVGEAGDQAMGTGCSPVTSCVVTPSPLWPSVEWEHVLPCLRHKADVEGEWKKEP